MKKVSTTVTYGVLILAAAVMCFPVLFSLALSFSDLNDILAGDYIPDSLNFTNYINAFQTQPLLHYMLNSAIVGVLSTALEIVFALLAAYAIVFIPFRAKKVVFLLMMATMMIPGEVLVITNFQTIQQTSEWSCGVTSVLMVLNWYDRLGDWNEESLAALRHSLDGTELEGYPGTTLVQALDMLDGVGGFTYTSTLDCQDVYSEFTLDTIQSTLAEGKPILIAWNDWGGHWQVIIGYDTLGTETTQDDVIIVADPYDTTDHNQDGYGIYPAERFYYNFTMYNQFPQEEGGNDMLFVIPTPAS